MITREKYPLAILFSRPTGEACFEGRIGIWKEKIATSDEGDCDFVFICSSG